MRVGDETQAGAQQRRPQQQRAVRMSSVHGMLRIDVDRDRRPRWARRNRPARRSRTISSTSVCGTPSASIMCLVDDAFAHAQANALPALRPREEIVQFAMEAKACVDHAASIASRRRCALRSDVIYWRSRFTSSIRHKTRSRQMDIGFIGLGEMGGAMAGNALQGGTHGARLEPLAATHASARGAGRVGRRYARAGVRRRRRVLDARRRHRAALGADRRRPAQARAEGARAREHGDDLGGAGRRTGRACTRSTASRTSRRRCSAGRTSRRRAS